MHFALLLAVVLQSVPAAPASNVTRIPIHGVVLRPDGAPASGARVEAVATCPGHVDLAAQADAASDGSFSIPGFPATCTPVSLRASLLSEYWLRTGNDVFFPTPNGTAPVVRPTIGAPPTTITLGRRGGKLVFDVWDEATGKPIRATVSFTRANTKGRALGILQSATGLEGQSHSLFLPPGDYVANIDWFSCGSRSFFPSQAAFTFSVSERAVQAVRLTVNTREMETIPSSDNPRAERCMP